MPNLTLADCVRLTEFAHYHDTDQSGAPYIDHPRRVLNGVQQIGAPPYTQMAAILHDVTEDTKFTPEILLELGVLPAAVDIVKLVDRGHSEKLYRQAVRDRIMRDESRFSVSSDFNKADRDFFYYVAIRQNPQARILKEVDIGDNSQPWRTGYLPEKKQVYLREKYTDALEILAGRNTPRDDARG